MHPHRLTTTNDVLTMMLAGNCTLTIKSVKTGTRFTFKIKKGDAKVNHTTGKVFDPIYFVNLLAGPDNTRDYSPLGCLRGHEVPTFGTGRWCRVPESAQSFVAFKWLYSLVSRHAADPNPHALPEGLEVWHEGKCGRCGRKLTVPESIAMGIGPECMQHVNFY